MPGLVLRDISKRYGGVQALDGINLQIQDGEFCVIVGPSGSGKTTLLNIIAGFVKPDNGEVLVDRKRFNELSPRDRNIGMVFQDIALFSHMTVRKNISLLAVDSPSVDFNVPEGQKMPIHQIILGAGIPIIEGLVNLDQIREERFFFIGLPINIKDADGAPCRPVAVEGLKI